MAVIFDTSNKWFTRSRVSSFPVRRLFCFPFAGGNSSTFHGWSEYLDSEVELFSVNLPGRLHRISENLIDNMDVLASQIYVEMLPYLDGEYYIFGHSMGTKIAHAVLALLKKSNKPMPAHFFISGGYPPHINDRKEKLHTLGDEELIGRVLNMGGTSPAVFNDPMLRDIFLPMLRADFKLIENYAGLESPERLDCKYSLMCGDSDSEVVLERLTEWSRYFMHLTPNSYSFSGGHFYLHKNVAEISSVINSTLKK